MTSGVNSGNGQIQISYSSIDPVTPSSPHLVLGESLGLRVTLDALNPTGVMEASLYGPGDSDCSLTPVFHDPQMTGPLSVGSTHEYESESFTPTQMGTYRWGAGYGSDPDNDSVDSDCQGTTTNVVVVVPAAPTGLDTSPASPSNVNTPKITGTASPGSTVSLYTTSDCSGTPVATGTAADFASPGFQVSVADNSSTNYYATATDVEVSECSGNPVTYIEDSVNPVATIASQPPALTSANLASFTYTASKPGSTFQCQLDSGTFASCPIDGIAYPSGGSGLPDGSHAFNVKATDQAGNVGPAASYTWTVNVPAKISKAKISKVTVSGPARVKKGKKATYKVKVTNSGVVPATGVKLNVSGKGARAKASVGTIAAGKTRAIKVRVIPKKAGKIRLSFKATSGNAGSATVKKTIAVNPG